VEQVGVQAEKAAPRPTQDVEALAGDAGFVDFRVAGTEVTGEFRCADCGYGAVVQRVLPPCPMCAGTVWESRGSTALHVAD
jgi:hypothetical protein